MPDPGKVAVIRNCNVQRASIFRKRTERLRRIRRGVIRIDRDPDTGRFLFPDTDKTMRALRQLRTGAIARIPVFLPNGLVWRHL